MEAMPSVDDNSDASATSTTLISNTPNATADAALAAVEAIPPLYAIVEPLMKQVTDGLAGMGKVVGSETASKDITPEMLATVVAVKERCDREVVLPLLELREVTATRHRELQSMYKRQKIQMESLREMVRALKERMEDLTSRMTTVESNASALAERGAYVVQASQDLQPTITQAEKEYYDMLKALEAKCAEWKAKLRKVEDSSALACDAVETGRANVTLQLAPDFVENANILLRSEASILKRGEKLLKQLDGELARLSRELGIIVELP
jgi:predicted RNase H-like nuclease (RuvC/YqgF family)